MALSLAAATLIGGGASLLGNLFGTSSTNKKNMEMAQYQNAMNLEQWHRENEYNLPINQMARFQNAGLNPNLIYGQGSTAASSPTMTAPTAVAPQIGENLSSTTSNYIGAKQSQAQIESLQAATVGQTINNSLNDLALAAERADFNVNRDLLKKSQEMLKTQVDAQLLQNRKTLQDIDLAYKADNREDKKLQLQLSHYNLELEKLGLQKVSTRIAQSAEARAQWLHENVQINETEGKPLWYREMQESESGFVRGLSEVLRGARMGLSDITTTIGNIFK